MAGFRILSCDDADNHETVFKKQKAYQDHLKTIRPKHKDLWKYFADGFFHDGTMEDFKFTDDLKNLTFRICCPNIVEFYGKPEKWKYRNIMFRCQFTNLAYFTIATKNHGQINDPLFSRHSPPMMYRDGEINTLGPQIEFYKKNYRKNFYSLILELMPFERWAYLVFEGVKVVLERPSAFRKLLSHRDIFVPTYQARMTPSQEKVMALVQERDNKKYGTPKKEPQRSKEWKRIETALCIYYADHNGVWPPRLRSLVPKYLRKIPLDGPSKSRKVVSRFDGTGGWVYRKHKQGIMPNRKLENE